MAKFTIPFLVIKPLARGGYGYYWQPSATMKKAGWTKLNLGISARADDPEKIDAARARNAELGEWRTGGEKPREVARFTHAHTIADVIRSYRGSTDFTNLRPKSKLTYSAALNHIMAWGTDPKQPGGPGNIRVGSITSDNVDNFGEALARPVEPGGPSRGHRAHNTLRVLRVLLQHAIKPMKAISINPANDFSIVDRRDPDRPASVRALARQQVWDWEDIQAICVAADETGYPDVGFLVLLAEWIGQREDDMLKMIALPPPSLNSNWREIHDLDPAMRARLVGADGRVMGICIRQEKTGQWIGPPIHGELRARIEARIAENQRRPVPTPYLFVNNLTGRPWVQGTFISRFAKCRAWAIDPPAEARAKGIQPRPQLKGLQFRDLRRTCVVRLGELNMEDQMISAITGHKLETTKAILEVYMPRNSKMASRAIIARIDAAQRDRAPDKERDSA